MRSKHVSCRKMGMRLIVFMLFSLCMPLSAIQQDSVKHFSISYAASSTGIFVHPKDLKWLAPVFTLFAGAIKEFAVKEFDSNNVLYNGLGVGSPVTVMELE